MRSKRLFRTSLLLTLAILVPLLSLNIPLAHAGSPNLFSNASTTCNADPCTITISVAPASEIIIVGDAIAYSPCDLTTIPSFTDSLGNSFVAQQAVGPIGGQNHCIFARAAVSSGAGGSDIITTHAYGGAAPITGTINVQDYTAFTGFGTSSTFTSLSASGSDTRTLSISSGSIVIGVGLVSVSGITCGTVSLGSGQITLANFQCQTVSGQGSALGVSTSSTAQSGSSYSDILSWTTPSGGGFGRFVMELTGSSTGGQTISVTQCYGNCGTPPITLANTNSTHTVNFNQSITLLYIFQSTLAGFVKNYTLNYAAVCGSGNKCVSNTLFMALYTIPSCGLGQTPFSAQCPGFRVSQASYSPPTKARLSGIASSVPVFNGQWVGVAVSATFSGIDINDTNTNVNLFQTNEGTTPPSIQQAIPVAGITSKMGLWAWITGNVVTGGPPTSPSSGAACGPGLDFILACAVNSLCTIVTTQCQTASSIFLIVILTIFSIAIMLGIFSYWLPGMNITTKGMGEFAILIFIGWFVAFAAYGLLLPYMIIFMFFVIAWLFLGRSKGTGPI